MQNNSDTVLIQLQNHIQVLERSNQVYEDKIQVSEEKIQVLEEKNKYLEFQLKELRRLIYGAKRERFVSNAAVNQLTLPFEVEQTTESVSATETISYTREKAKKRNHPGRIDFPSHLPVV